MTTVFPTLLHRFLHWEAAQAEVIALTEPRPDGRVVDYSWREIGDQARRMAAHLESLGLPPRSNIAILGRNSAHWIMADLAIWMAGHVSVPLYPTISAASARHILEHSEARLLFVGKLDGKADNWNQIRTALPQELPLIALPLSPLPQAQQWEALTAATVPLQQPHLPDAGEMATILYTSGTTGVPKGVMHSFGNMARYAQGSGDFCGFTPADRLLSYLPLAHAAERSFVEANLLAHGLRVYFNDALETFVADLQRARPTVFISMPRLWTNFYAGVCAKLPATAQALLGADSPEGAALRQNVLAMLGLPDVRIAFTGSAPLPPEIVDWYRKLGLELLDVYGMTEDFCWSHYSRPGAVRLGYCGEALPGVQARIAANGEIEVKTVTRMLGYYKDPALTASALTDDGYFRTGDRGEYDEANRLKITGRVKELFKTSKGKYVAPAPIENRFAHPMVEAVCVTGAGHPQPFVLLMPSLAARQQMGDPAARDALVATWEALLGEVNATLEPHEALSHVVVVKEPWTIDNGFLTPTMKIRRSIIEERYLGKAAAWAAPGSKVVLETD
ncbi:AMP-binding protein [Ramlibacter solisilvae]|uniref:AMP-binding acetyl-CoA synthetase n=1 Tax=Ramlibacter tataouinensis TaxID=94132 RepID=A0A127JW02_9BURK|nr:AMP-binding protein [Ramlibacter tataouinensis]AMO24101.1 AMP-binding acetyl-CoA synthetase [Ramlibacter tataouinensis]